MARRKFGRGFAPDPRDRKFRLWAAASKRKARTWRIGPISDQGPKPSCVGHAWRNWLAASPIRQRPVLADGLYEVAKKYDEWQGENYEGTSVRAGAKVLTLLGHVVEYNWEWEIEPAMNYLLEKSPLVFGTNWYQGMMSPDAEGFIHVKGQNRGGHAYLVYKVDLRRGIAGIANSWSADWGVDGTCLISLDDLATLLSEDGECCAAKEIRVR